MMRAVVVVVAPSAGVMDDVRIEAMTEQVLALAGVAGKYEVFTEYRVISPPSVKDPAGVTGVPGIVLLTRGMDPAVYQIVQSCTGATQMWLLLLLLVETRAHPAFCGRDPSGRLSTDPVLPLVLVLVVVPRL